MKTVVQTVFEKERVEGVFLEQWFLLLKYLHQLYLMSKTYK